VLPNLDWRPFRAIISNALSKSFASSEASTSCAVSTKRSCRSASVSLGKRFAFGFCDMPHNVASSKGNSSWAESGSLRFRRQKRGRLGRLLCPLTTSCLISEPLSARSKQREISSLYVIKTEFHSVRITEIKFG